MKIITKILQQIIIHNGGILDTVTLRPVTVRMPPSLLLFNMVRKVLANTIKGKNGKYRIGRETINSLFADNITYLEEQLE